MIVELDTLLADSVNTFLNEMAPPGITTPVLYLGRPRPLGEATARYMDYRLLQSVHDSTFRARFEREVAFVEGRDTVWLPIQTSLLPDMQMEVMPGDSLILFLRWLGVYKENQLVTWLFTVNEFVASRSRAQWQRALARCPQRVLPQ